MTFPLSIRRSARNLSRGLPIQFRELALESNTASAIVFSPDRFGKTLVFELGHARDAASSGLTPVASCRPLALIVAPTLERPFKAARARVSCRNHGGIITCVG